MLKDYLDAHKFTYTEKLVDIDESAKDEMMASSGGFLGVPFTLIILDNGQKETVLGFDKGKFQKTLNIPE